MQRDARYYYICLVPAFFPVVRRPSTHHLDWVSLLLPLPFTLTRTSTRTRNRTRNRNRSHIRIIIIIFPRRDY